MMRFICYLLLLLFTFSCKISAGQLYIENHHGHLFTHPSLTRHERRYWDNTRFLFEKTVPFDGRDDLECIYEAVDMLPLSMPYYSYYYGRDTHIMTDILKAPQNLAVVAFSRYLNQEASLLHSGEGYAPGLFLSSLLKKMCPGVVSRTNYDYLEDNVLYDYVIIEYKK